MATSPISHAAASTTASDAAAAASTAALGNENTFLQLLVAQIQNQDPTQPIDSSTFLSQLASFSQLEQLIGIKQDTDKLIPTGDTTGSTSSTSGN
jgi:flagellar basal-body rod modification protein FlgD